MGKLDIMRDDKSKVFLKHEKRAFFQKDKTKNALRDLAKAEKILIYCGAGVTYDLTNLGWDDLIKEVFEESFKEEGSLFSCWENMVRLVVGRTLFFVSR